MSDRKKLALLLPNLGGGGAERVALRLAAEFVARGHQVDLVVLQAEGELVQQLPAGVRLVDLAAARIRNGLWPLVRYLRQARPDALQALMWPVTVLAIIAHRLARSRARLVTADHTTLSRHFGDLGRLKRLLMNGSIRLFYPMADARVIVSEGAADDLSKLTGLARESIQVIYNPVSAPPPVVPAQADALWTPGSARILTVGNLKEEKNHGLLIRAFARLARERPAQLTILGEGPCRPALTRLAAEEGVVDRVHLPGFRADPSPFYQSAHLFALSSNYEGYPLVLLEAMQCGLQIVSTDCESGPREILDNGRYGALVPCYDVGALASALEEALLSPREPAILRERASQLAGSKIFDAYLHLMVGDGDLNK
jgi:glycosyltransferase involved in cell wall biosynthesis